MSEEPLIRCEGVGKKFCRNLRRSLFYGLQDVAGELVFRKGKSEAQEEVLRPEEFWAVRDVSFEVKRGECLAILGHNGAGKTTLLKMLSGLIKPDTGQITLRGKVGGLVALSAGFNPVLSGRENVYVNGSILGMSRRQISAVYDEVVAFAELEDHMETPVRNLSSGMAVRLGFAVAALMTKPDVFLLDEVLAVGDTGFAHKCFNLIMGEAKNRAIIFVSHSMPLVARISSGGIVLNGGRVVIQSNDKSKFVNAYQQQFALESGAASELRTDFRMKSIEVVSAEKGAGGLPEIRQGEPLDIEIEVEDETGLSDGVMFCNAIVYTQSMAPIGATEAYEFTPCGGNFRIHLRFDSILLSSGIYGFTVGFNYREPGKEHTAVIATYSNCLRISVEGIHSTVDATGAFSYLPEQWSLQPHSSPISTS